MLTELGKMLIETAANDTTKSVSSTYCFSLRYNGVQAYITPKKDGENCEYISASSLVNLVHFINGQGCMKKTGYLYYGDAVKYAESSVIVSGSRVYNKILENYVAFTSDYNSGTNETILNAVFTNTSDSAIVIQYIGQNGKNNFSAYNTTQSVGSCNALLWYRELETPIVLQPGESYPLRLNFKLP